MKKFIHFLIIFSALFVFTLCNNNDNDKNDGTSAPTDVKAKILE